MEDSLLPKMPLSLKDLLDEQKPADDEKPTEKKELAWTLFASSGKVDKQRPDDSIEEEKQVCQSHDLVFQSPQVYQAQRQHLTQAQPIVEDDDDVAEETQNALGGDDFWGDFDAHSDICSALPTKY